MKMISRAGQCPSSTISLSLACQRLSHGKKEAHSTNMTTAVCTSTMLCQKFSIISSAPRPRPISTTMLSLTSNDTKIKITAEKLVPLVGKRLFVVSFKMFHKACMSYSQLNPQGFRCPVLKNCAQNNENFTFKKDDISTMLCASNVFRAVSN